MAKLCVRIANIPKKWKNGHTVRAVSDAEDLNTVEPNSVYKVPLRSDSVFGTPIVSQSDSSWILS